MIGIIIDFEKEFLGEKLNDLEELVSIIIDFKFNFLKYIVFEN